MKNSKRKWYANKIFYSLQAKIFITIYLKNKENVNKVHIPVQYCVSQKSHPPYFFINGNT